MSTTPAPWTPGPSAEARTSSPARDELLDLLVAGWLGAFPFPTICIHAQILGYARLRSVDGGPETTVSPR